jgi:hypothetical protein
VVPKHRRSETEPYLASVRAPVDSAEFWPEAVGFGQAAAMAGPADVHAWAGPAGDGHPASSGYDGAAADLGWAAAPEGHPWEEWHDWQDWGPPPALHPDHPSAPVPRIRVAADYPPGPMSAPPELGAPDLPQRRSGGPARTWGAQPPPPDTGDRRLYAVPNDALAADYGATALRPSGNPGRRFPGQPGTEFAGPDWPETTAFRRQPGPSGPGPGPAAGPSQSDHFPNRDSLWMAGQVLTLADGAAAQIAQQTQDYAAAIREAAEREAAAITQQATSRADAITQEATGQAAAIRAAAEREAAELRARLDSMSGELGRVAAYVTESLAGPAMTATAPALPGARPALPGARPAPPGAAPARPATRPPKPATRPAGPATTPAKPATRPAKPATTPAKKPQKPGRQQQAIRIATAATAALFLFAVGTGATEIGLHGFPFFVFRPGGTGETRGHETDQQFLARQAAAAHHVVAPKGRHHKKPHQTLEVHHK